MDIIEGRRVGGHSGLVAAMSKCVVQCHVHFAIGFLDVLFTPLIYTFDTTINDIIVVTVFFYLSL